MSALPETVAELDALQHRVVAEAVLAGEAATWLRLADMLERARPRAGDFHGQATREELRARYDRLTEEAQACRNRAAVCAMGGESR